FNTLLYWILKLFPVGTLVEEAGDLIRAAEAVVATQFGIATTRQEGTSCNDVSIIFARGTGEVGNVGVLVGPELFDAVLARLNGTSTTLAVQGVNYAADVSGFLLGGDPAGSQQMQVLSFCPKTNIVMAGYSQGGQLIHNAVKLLSMVDHISSVVIFGDPNYPATMDRIAPLRQLVICHDNDLICGRGDMILLPHLTYAQDVGHAADFI
ncbi:family 5 carbohydrate esterase, partial [Lasiosphaeris hirsuta]